MARARAATTIQRGYEGLVAALAAAGSTGTTAPDCRSPDRARPSASMNAFAVGYRSARLTASDSITTRSRAVETEVRSNLALRGGSLSRFAMMICAVGPVCGASPTSISNSVQPRL